MTTYANIKLSEIFALYGNPFTRGTCKKNVRVKLINKHFKKINFEEIIKNDNNESKTIKEGNSKILLLSNKNDNGLMLLKNAFTEQNNNNKSQSFIKFGNIHPKNETYKNTSKVHLNTDTFSVYSQKKRTQQELIRKTRANFTSEENVDNTKMSSIVFAKKLKENISHISQFNNNKE